MTIWEHKPTSSDHTFVSRAAKSSTCIYCNEKMQNLKSYFKHDGESKGVNLTGTTYHLWCCPICGWWNANGSLGTKDRHYYRIEHRASVGILKKLDIADISTPVNEIQSFLAAKWEERRKCNPKLFEDTVVSVFGTEYEALPTAYTKDGGIDCILIDANGKEIGVQVKRTKKTISVAQIRELLGAVMLRGFTQGIFVTTSNFSPPAVTAANLACSLGTRIELINGREFLEALKIAQRKMYPDRESFIHEVGTPALEHILDIDEIERGYPQWIGRR